MSRRQAQVESTLQRALSQVLARKVSDPRIRGLVSVMRVALDPTFKTAIVYISVIPDQYLKRTLHGLNSGAGMFQSQLAKTMAIKTIPQLEFRVDDGLRKEYEILDDIQRGLDREGLSASDVTHVGEKGDQSEEGIEDIKGLADTNDTSETNDETTDTDDIDDVSTNTTENQSR